MNSSWKVSMLLLALLMASCYASTEEATEDAAAAQRELFFQDVYDEMDMSMSMENGKGYSSSSKKGKSGKKSSKSKSGKKSGKKGKKSKGKGKGGEGGEGGEGGRYPTASPNPGLPETPTASPDPSRPTPTAPTTPTPPTGPGPDDTVIGLSIYNLLYTLDQSRIPNLQDYRGVTDITEEYLDEFFDGVLRLSQDIIYTGSITETTDRNFDLGKPVGVEYNTTMFFSPSSTLVPTDAELNALLMSAFRGSQNDEYLKAVQSLPPTNIFETTTEVQFSSGKLPRNVGRSAGTDADGAQEEETQGESANTQKIGIAAAAAAGAMVLLFTGVAIYRRRDEDEDPVGKFLDNDGHVTVAGETFAGDTYAGASSLDSQSGVHHISRPYEPTNWDQYQESEMAEDPLHRSESPQTTLEDLQEDSFDDDESEVETLGYDTL